MQKRDFLKGSFAALGGFGFAGMAAAKSDIPEAKDIKWDETFDVVVVGSGIAATCAGNEALDLGAKRVIMVDKMPVFGGNSAITGFWINVPRSLNSSLMASRTTPLNSSFRTPSRLANTSTTRSSLTPFASRPSKALNIFVSSVANLLRPRLFRAATPAFALWLRRSPLAFL